MTDLASTRLHGLTVALCTLAIITAAIGICGADGFSGLDFGWLVGSILVTIAAALLSRRFIRNDAQRRTTAPHPPRWLDAIGPLLVAGYVGNIAIEPIVRLLGGGRPLEIMLYAGMASLLPILAAGAVASRWVPIAGVISLAVTLFGVCLLSDPAVAVAAALWAALVPLWLVVFTDESTAGVRLADAKRRSRKLTIAAGSGGLLLLVLLAASLSGRESLSMSGGFLSSSGGDGMESEYARNGVGDGRHLVPATTMAESFGPLDDAPFAKSDEPSLYDVIEQQYDDAEVIKVSKNDRAVSLTPEQVQEEEREMAEAEAAGRAFSTLRSPRDERRGQVGDKLSNALFYVAGRSPLHLRTAVFEEFDGIVWSPGEHAEEDLLDLSLQTVDEQPWFVLRNESEPRYRELGGLLSEPEPHAIKPVHIDEPLIPLPPSATAIHIRDVALESMFQPLPGRLMKMQRKRLPKMVPIHIASRRIDRDRLLEDRNTFYGGPHSLHALPAAVETSAVADLATEWVAGLDRGWPQIAEIERRLRAHARHSRSVEPDLPSAEDYERPERSHSHGHGHGHSHGHDDHSHDHSKPSATAVPPVSALLSNGTASDGAAPGDNTKRKPTSSANPDTAPITRPTPSSISTSLDNPTDALPESSANGLGRAVSDFPVTDFLLSGTETDRQAPDYLFATAAAVMLRSQGYATRLVSGFYVRPEKYDPEGGHTPVHASDLHTWCEVRMACGEWVTIDPTPGYSVLGPQRSLWYHMKKAIQALPGTIWRVRWSVAAIATLLLSLFVARHELTDMIWTAWLRLSGRTTSPLAVWRLIDWRLKQVTEMPAGWTPRRRIAALTPPPDVTADADRLAAAIERASFSGASLVETSDATTTGDFAPLLRSLSRSQMKRWLAAAHADEPSDHEATAAVRKPAATDADRTSKTTRTKETAL